jgi:hypothetical protein
MENISPENAQHYLTRKFEIVCGGYVRLFPSPMTLALSHAIDKIPNQVPFDRHSEVLGTIKHQWQLACEIYGFIEKSHLSADSICNLASGKWVRKTADVWGDHFEFAFSSAVPKNLRIAEVEIPVAFCQTFRKARKASKNTHDTRVITVSRSPLGPAGHQVMVPAMGCAPWQRALRLSSISAT